MELKHLIIIISLLLLLIYAWWQLFFRKKKNLRLNFSTNWRPILQEKIRFYQSLSLSEKDRFEQAMLHFFEDVKITGVGIEPTDTDKLLVAASAVIPLFGFPNWRYRNLNEVLLYKGTFSEEYQTEGKERNVLGMVGSGAMNRMMILSQPALHQGFENQLSRSNVGIHEFVHLLDKADGTTDGIPEVLMQKQFTIPWIKLMHDEIKKIKTGHSDINPYGATNEAEFLSVVSEYFFNQPHLLKKSHPALFELLNQIFHQDLTK